MHFGSSEAFGRPREEVRGLRPSSGPGSRPLVAWATAGSPYYRRCYRCRRWSRSSTRSAPRCWPSILELLAAEQFDSRLRLGPLALIAQFAVAEPHSYAPGQA